MRCEIDAVEFHALVAVGFSRLLHSLFCSMSTNRGVKCATYKVHASAVCCVCVCVCVYVKFGLVSFSNIILRLEPSYSYSLLLLQLLYSIYKLSYVSE